MDSPAGDFTHDFPPYFRVHRDGRIERYDVLPDVPPSVDPTTGVESKDVVISPENNVNARVFIPKIDGSDPKLPLILHIHGGGFCIGSPFNAVCHRFINSVASITRSIVVSVDYRLAPEHPLPIAYDDSWSALQWIATHSTGQGPDPWINNYADLGRVFLMGESAGAVLAHYVAVRAGSTGITDLNIRGMIISHPFFADKEPDKMVRYLYPTSSGSDDDPKLNPVSDPDLPKMGCPEVIVYVAEKDWLKPRGVAYYETLKKSAWSGNVEIVVNEGEDHVFHVFDPYRESALALTRNIASFISQK